MTLLTICQDALKEIPEFEVPETIIGNKNQTAVKVLAQAQREGTALAKDETTWQALQFEHVITTDASNTTGEYSLPSDFRSFVDETWWDRTNTQPLIGPINPQEWQRLKSGGISSIVNRAFRIRGNKFLVHPVPTVSAEELVFEYVSTDWVVAANGTDTRTRWEVDSDTSRFDEDLMSLGVKWRFLQSNGLDYEEDFNAYERMKAAIYGRDKGNKTLYMDGSHSRRFDRDSIPETGFGL